MPLRLTLLFQPRRLIDALCAAGAISFKGCTLMLVRALPAIAALAKATEASNEATAKPQQLEQATTIAITVTATITVQDQTIVAVES